MIRKVIGIYFSPAGGTAIMTRRLTEGIAEKLRDCSPEEIRVEYHDLSAVEEAPSFDEETIAVAGMPVYVGKLPLPAVKAMKLIDGCGAQAVLAASYGGRSYGNALYELQRTVEDQCFRVIGAGAFLMSYRAIRGSQRSAAPAMDIKALSDYTNAAAAKIMRLHGCEVEGLKIKPAPVEVNGRMPVHKISRISPKAAAAAEKLLEKISMRHHRSEWFL